MEPAPIKVVIADDHTIYRDGLKLLLNKQKDIEMAGEASNWTDLITLVKRVQPNVVLTDIKMPGMEGIQGVQQIKVVCPACEVIALSMLDDEGSIIEIILAGAKGYLIKSADKTEILNAIHSVQKQKIFYCSETASKLSTDVCKTGEVVKVDKKIFFTKRQLEVIQFICEGFITKEIACKIFLSIKAVEKCRTQIFREIKANNMAEVVAYAIEHKLYSKK